jgi:hypothetical protein
MGPNRRAQERERAAAERKAAEVARKLVARAERTSRRARTRSAVIRDGLLAVVIALILFGLWKVALVLAVP